MGPCGAMVARLTPDKKVACSNHVKVRALNVGKCHSAVNGELKASLIKINEGLPPDLECSNPDMD